jgi:hypothetical protein
LRFALLRHLRKSEKCEMFSAKGERGKARETDELRESPILFYV